MKFNALTEILYFLYTTFSCKKGGLSNRVFILRQWLIGCYITAYQATGEDRDTAGIYLMSRLAEAMTPAMDYARLQQAVRFYTMYPEIAEIVSHQLACLVEQKILPTTVNQLVLPTAVTRATGSRQRSKTAALSILITQLSYHHFIELTKVTDPVKRHFYETKALKHGWSARELDDQIRALYYESICIRSQHLF
jgi:hypothetical protein